MPGLIFTALSTLFPDVLFTIEYADEDIGNNCGTVKYLGGKLKESNIQKNNDGINWNKFAFELCHPGVDPKEYEMDENYEYIEE